MYLYADAHSGLCRYARLKFYAGDGKTEGNDEVKLRERESESAFTRPLFLNWMNMQAFAYVKHGVDCT